MKRVFTVLAVGVIAAACSFTFCSKVGLNPFGCTCDAVAPVELDRWRVIEAYTKPTSVRVVVFDTATGTVEAYEVPITDEVIPETDGADDVIEALNDA